MKSVTSYPFSMATGATFRIPAGGTYFRIQSASGPMNVTIEGAGTLPSMQSGQGIKDTPFDGLILRNTHTTSNSGSILVANEEFIDNRTYGVNDLSSGSLDTIRRPLQATGFYATAAPLTANTPEVIFSAASNVNGAIILSANWTTTAGGALITTLVANAVAPVSNVDGEVFGSSEWTASNFGSGCIQKEQYVAAGKGLYFISNGTEAGGSIGFKNCRFRLL